MGQAESKQEMFWQACGFGRAHLVEKFIEHGIDVNFVSTAHDYSPIHVASQGKSDVVNLLIEAKCDLSVVDARGNTALHHAAMRGHADIVEILMAAGSDPNAQDKNGWTPLHCAAYYAHLVVVEVLTKNKNCDIFLLNKDGRSALVETARSKEHSKEQVLGEIAKHLIQAGCDVDLKCTDLGEGDFTGLMFAAYHNHVEVAASFMDGGCDLDAASLCTKWTALHWAADRGNDEMVYILLEAGADPTKRGNRGELASERATDKELKEFLENAVNVYKDLEAVNAAPLSSPHSVNAKASLDTAKALETLSSHAKNRDILSTQMPSMPALGIASRSDPKERYIRRNVQEVAAQTVAAVFPWRSYSKQATPSPDRDGVEINGDDRPKMFPLQDDKTNAFMDSLARRIDYMTSRIASMSEDGSREGSVSKQDDSRNGKSIFEIDSKSDGDSGLSTRGGSRNTSQMATPENDNRQNGLDFNSGDKSPVKNSDPTPNSPLSPISASSKSASKVSSPSKDQKLDLQADACLIQENNRGFAILKALQERHRRSMIMEDVVVIPGVNADGGAEDMLVVVAESADDGLSSGTKAKEEVVLPGDMDMVAGDTVVNEGNEVDDVSSSGMETEDDMAVVPDDAGGVAEDVLVVEGDGVDSGSSSLPPASPGVVTDV